MKLKNNPSAQPQYDINELLNKIIIERFYETDYKNITSKLLYENVTYDEVIENCINTIIANKMF